MLLHTRFILNLLLPLSSTFSFIITDPHSPILTEPFFCSSPIISWTHPPISLPPPPLHRCCSSPVNQFFGFPAQLWNQFVKWNVFVESISNIIIFSKLNSTNANISFFHETKEYLINLGLPASSLLANFPRFLALLSSQPVLFYLTFSSFSFFIQVLKFTFDLFLYSIN